VGRGILRAGGGATWSGPVSDPLVEAVVSGRNLAVGRNSSPSIGATEGALDGVVKGPLTNLAGGGTLTVGSVAIGGRGAGTVSADLTLSERTIRVATRVPSVNTALDVTIGLENPHSFDGHGTLVDSEIAPLLEIAGLEQADPGAVRGRISSSISFKGDMQTWSSTSVMLDVAPLDVTVFDVPLAASGGLRARLTGGRLEFEDVAMTIGDVAVRAGGRGPGGAQASWRHPTPKPGAHDKDKRDRGREQHDGARQPFAASGSGDRRRRQHTIENVAREQLTPVEEARAYAVLLDEFGLALGDVADRVGRSKPSVSNRIRLLDLPDDVLGMLERGQLTEGHARAVLAVPDHEGRRRLAREIVQKGLSVRAAEQRAKWAGAKRKPRVNATPVDPALAARVRDALERLTGFHAKVTRGRVELTFADEHELAELAEALERL